MGLAGEKPMMPAPPKVWPVWPELESVDVVPPEDVLPVDPVAPELSVPVVALVPPELSNEPVVEDEGDCVAPGPEL